jgi:hypothetical protein
VRNNPALSFVQYGPQLMPPPPYVHRGVRMYSFARATDIDLIQQLCDRWFKSPSNGAVQYKVLLPSVFAMILKIHSVAPADSKYSYLGDTSEIDAGLWTMVLRSSPYSIYPMWLPIQMWVDSGEAAFIGREIYGFPKQLGSIAVPDSDVPERPFSVSAVVTPSKGAKADWRELICIRPVGAIQSTSGAPQWGSLLDVYGSLFPDFKKFSDVLVPELMRMVFLKQMMDSNSSGEAVYQAIVEANAGVLTFGGAGLTGQTYEMNILSFPSHPFCELLGLIPGWQNVGRGLWVDFDFVMQDGETIWSAAS